MFQIYSEQKKQLIIKKFVYGSDKTRYISNQMMKLLKKIISPSNPFKNCSYKEYSNNLTYKNYTIKCEKLKTMKFNINLL